MLVSTYPWMRCRMIRTPKYGLASWALHTKYPRVLGPKVANRLEEGFDHHEGVKIWNKQDPTRPLVGGIHQPRFWFDGGLRVRAITTAMRLGAREVTVVTGAHKVARGGNSIRHSMTADLGQQSSLSTSEPFSNYGVTR